VSPKLQATKAKSETWNDIRLKKSLDSKRNTQRRDKSIQQEEIFVNYSSDRDEFSQYTRSSTQTTQTSAKNQITQRMQKKKK
jgi:hypothetical protein